MMKFLTDENIGLSLTEFLRSKGYDVKSVSEFFPSRDDTSIINIAYQEDKIINHFIVVSENKIRIRQIKSLDN
jgi:predicted nuclease of predicted toxin-antitoxin system